MALRTDEERDEKLNPGNTDYDQKFQANASDRDQATDRASAESGDNISQAREAEMNPSGDPLKEGLYRPSGGDQKQKLTAKGKLKKRGPISLIISLLLGGGGAFSIMFAPGIGIVQLKEAMVGDLNDQLSAMDLRTDKMFRAKLKGLQANGSVCSGPINIRCKFATMSDRQVEKFKKAGFEVETAREGIMNRQRITSLSLPDGTKINNPGELTRLRKTPSVRSAMNKVYNPMYAGFSDSKAMTVLREKLRLTKNKITITGDIETDDEALRSRLSGEELSTAVIKTDPDKGEYITDDDGTPVYKDDNPDRFAELRDAGAPRIDAEVDVAKATGKAAQHVFGSAIKGLSVVGVADTACTVYNTARAVAAAAKATRSLQLAQYAMNFLTVADAIKAGDATPEDVEYFGNILTATDSREKIFDENSPPTENSTRESVDIQQRDNPYYGKNAFDSAGYSVAAYNDAPNLSSQSLQYTVGGGLTGTLSGVMNDISGILGKSGPEAIRATCGNIQSWWARGLGLAAGVLLAIGSFGTGTAISIGASVAMGFALPFLEAALADIIAGTTVSPDTKGPEAGDAIFSGSAVIMGSVAQARGLQPLSSEGIESYLAITDSVKSDVIAAEVYDARDEPFNINNQYSFLGSFARSINPTVISVSSNVASAVTEIPSLVSSSFASVIPKASAASTYNPERYKKCADDGYASLGIDADIFCNVRYGLSAEELNMDPEEVVDYMVENEFIDYYGEPLAEYQTFIDNCADRVDGWGDASEENGSLGSECVDKGKSAAELTRLHNFRIYTIDKTINDGMDDEEETATTGSTTNTNIDVSALYKDSSSIDCAAGTKDTGVVTGYAQGNPVKIRLCELPNTISVLGVNGPKTVVNSRVSGAWQALTTDLQKYLKKQSPSALLDGKVKISDSFRSREEQAAAFEQQGCSYPPLYCRGRLTALPGHSNHGMGLALDIQLPSGNEGAERKGDVVWEWLTAHSKKYGIRQLSSESWHWEPVL